MSIARRIISEHAGVEVHPDEHVIAKVDLCFGNDITFPPAVKVLKENDIDEIKGKVVAVASHFVPAKDLKSAEQIRLMNDYAKRKKIPVVGYGVDHAILPELGYIKPKMLVVGADSHTPTQGALGAMSIGVGSTDLAFCIATGKIWLMTPSAVKVKIKGKRKDRWITGKDVVLWLLGRYGTEGATYKSLEFEGASELEMDERFPITNMSAEMGAKCAIMETDGITEEFLKGAGVKEIEHVKLEGEYNDEWEVDLEKLEPQVAYPHSPANVKTIREAVKDKIEIDQVFIGSCTGGYLRDIKVAAEILKGKKVRTRLIVIPASPGVWRRALEEGYLKILDEAGAIICPPNCGPCLGGHMGVLAKGERCASTSNRNFIGRMGHPESEVFLVSSAVASASAAAGRIAHPDEMS